MFQLIILFTLRFSLLKLFIIYRVIYNNKTKNFIFVSY